MSKKKHANTDELRAEFARKLSAATKDLSKKQVAVTLGISRQMLYLYLNEEATPGGEVIQKACEAWKLTLIIKGQPFTGGAFGPDATTRTNSSEPPAQLRLLLAQLRNDQIEAKVVSRKGGIFLLSLEIKEVA